MIVMFMILTFIHGIPLFMSASTTKSSSLGTVSPHDLDNMSAYAILQWSVETYFPRLTVATAFGPESCCIIHMLAEIEPQVRIFNLDTGYQFPETLDMYRRMQDRYGIEIERVQPQQSVQEFESQHEGPLYKSSPDKCCHQRKVIPLQDALQGYDAWISGIRRDQSPFRKDTPALTRDKKFNLDKISPLIHWTKKDVWDFVSKHDIPYNPLHDQGYPSIGCWPCTRSVEEGTDERAGRWVGFNKTECGLHS